MTSVFHAANRPAPVVLVSNAMEKRERVVAAKRRDPTAAGRKQIENRFNKIYAGDLVFISIQNMQAWYGRYDDAAVEKLESAWREFWSGQDWTPSRAPKLFAVGPTNNPKGYAVGRSDQKKNWLY